MIGVVRFAKFKRPHYSPVIKRELMDGISAKMLKGTALNATPVLMQLSIQSGIFPEKWKLSSVVPIPKGGDCSNPSNYRPIILSVVSKMLEQHIHHLLTQHLASDLLTPKEDSNQEN